MTRTNAREIVAQLVYEMQFREDDEVYAVAPNDFRDSTIRNWLNDDYLGILQENGLKNGDILDLEVDLKCTLGQHEYGKDKVKVGLLTLEEYGGYYDVIPHIDSPWWLATPWKTPIRSLYASNTSYVWYINSQGGNDRETYYDSHGVRPALNLSPSLWVTWEDENLQRTRQDVLLEQFPDTRLGKDGVITICPNVLGQKCPPHVRGRVIQNKDCAYCRHDFWLGEAK